MIYHYSCKNFYSINDKITVRFDVNKKAPDSNSYSAGDGGRVSMIEAVVGANASGKTNTIKALRFIKYLIAETAGNDSDDEIQFRTFQDSNTPTEVSTKFSVNGRIFLYEFVLTQQRILKETLREQSKSAQRTTYKRLIDRTWDHGRYSVNDYVFQSPKGFQFRDNASMVSHISLIDQNSLASDIVKYWRDCVISNVWESGNHDDGRVHGDNLTRSAIDFLYDNEELKGQATELLRLLDVGFHDFELEELKLEKAKIYRIKHSYGGNNFSTPLAYESSGTKRTILILRYILHAISMKGGVAALDELDAYLHPDIVEALVKLFTSPETNPFGAQLIFSSHTHQLLAELDKQQITLVEKDERGATEVWRLDDITGVRADDNYFTKYIAGAYGGKPRINL